MTARHDQFPAYYDQLSGHFSFNPGPALPNLLSPQTSLAPQTTEVAPPDPCDAARSDWQVLANTRSLSALEQFSSVHSNCPLYAAAARDRLNSLSAQAVTPTPAVPQPVQPQPAPAPTTIVTGDICGRLWYERNLIYHNRGYCFQTARAKSVFDTSQCTTRSPNLTAAESAAVAQIQAAERANGC